ncbi:hypothetical protein QJS10_CPB22g00358 [Acorus calamus]|uniref:Uncharacterized protein n=1 Tax=Acorus calamus TaxID=4465 RepID=A0AAV9C2K2_ACOCL|nr:hypothetical protein QJS10_CPB22g00358 [Acorus calamus]
MMKGVKRKPGRPKGSTKLKPTINKHEDIKPPSLKRGRGRPKKIIKDPKAREGERNPPPQSGTSVDDRASFDSSWLHKIDLPDEIIPEMFAFEDCSLEEFMRDVPEPSGQDDDQIRRPADPTK